MITKEELAKLPFNHQNFRRLVGELMDYEAPVVPDPEPVKSTKKASKKLFSKKED